MILCDTGVLVAAAVRNDKHYYRCTEMFSAFRLAGERLLVPQTVVAETGYMLESRVGAAVEAVAERLGASDIATIKSQRSIRRTSAWSSAARDGLHPPSRESDVAGLSRISSSFGGVADELVEDCFGPFSEVFLGAQRPDERQLSRQCLGAGPEGQRLGMGCRRGLLLSWSCSGQA